MSHIDELRELAEDGYAASAALVRAFDSAGVVTPPAYESTVSVHVRNGHSNLQTTPEIAAAMVEHLLADAAVTIFTVTVTK